MRIGHFASEGSAEFATLANRFKSIKNFIKLTHCRLLNRLLLFRDLVCRRPAKMAPSINHYHLQVSSFSYNLDYMKIKSDTVNM